MMKYIIQSTIHAKAETLYNAWLDSELHSAMTGGQAKCSDQVGGQFTAWDGYISGANLELEPNKRILQCWRTTEFVADEKDSILEILFDANGDKTKITLIHSNLPEHGAQYKQGWKNHYFNPMKSYFNQQA
jgi:activator of HSP90 ATPase